MWKHFKRAKKPTGQEVTKKYKKCLKAEEAHINISQNNRYFK